MDAKTNTKPAVEIWTGLALEIDEILIARNALNTSVAAMREAQIERHEAACKMACEAIAKTANQAAIMSAHIAKILAVHMARNGSGRE